MNGNGIIDGDEGIVILLLVGLLVMYAVMGVWGWWRTRR